MKTEIRVEGLLDVPRTLERFHFWGEDPANRFLPGVFRRAVRVGGRWRGYEVRWTGRVDDARLLVSTPGDRSAIALEAAVDEVGRICGLGLDVDGFYRFAGADRNSTRLNSSHVRISYAVFCLKKKEQKDIQLYCKKKKKKKTTYKRKKVK